MPVHLASAGLSSIVTLDNYGLILGSILALTTLKTWSAGVDLLEKLGDGAKDLHGRVLLVAGGLTPTGLLVCSYLSNLGAQLILLTPEDLSSSADVLQLVELLRQGTSNELIYAEQCDLLSLSSIDAFVSKWSNSDGTDEEQRPSVSTPAAGLEGAAANTRRLDGIVFLPLEEASYRVGSRLRRTKEQAHEISHAETLGRFHLVNSLLPSLLLLPPDRDIRIVSSVSPWYSSGIASLDLEDLDWRSADRKSLAAKAGAKGFPSRSPWTVTGAAGLLWLLLSRELQRRLHLLAEADTRPRGKLAGIVPDPSSPLPPKGATQNPAPGASRIPSNISLVNVCPGFERNADLLRYVPRRTGLFAPLGWLIFVILWPLAWLFGKSPKRCAQSVVWAIVAPLEVARPDANGEIKGLAAGELHREGKVMKRPLDTLDDAALTELWKREEGFARSRRETASATGNGSGVSGASGKKQKGETGAKGDGLRKR